MKVGLIINPSSNPLVLEEYKNFSINLQELLNQKFQKNEEMQILEINSDLTNKISSIDLIIFTGGEDVHPRNYYQEIKYPESFYSFNLQRDEIELEILEKTHKSKPIFAICRGIQLINVYFGGTLFQHLPYDLKGISIENAHKIYPEIKDFDKKRKLRHLIKGKILELLNFTSQEEKDNFVWVNSRHHQAVARLAKNLEILALAKDGVVEILRHQSLPILATQYHIEQQEILPNQIPLVKYFLSLF
ncbi:MAG: gamma-glutamyl-gamma-aminobutyrate hydrolase family protein [bacterium]